ncbi:hypothetical protein [Ligilactobacillus animalis]|uniref:hypothetical protein n=1 Tax=Ligilactobacillus animalis TaxID=1605 RepID=UPI0038515647
MKKKLTRQEKEDFKDFIMNYLQYGHVANFAEIELMFELRGLDWRGEWTIGDHSHNTVLWYGWNKSAKDIISELADEGKIYFLPLDRALEAYEKYNNVLEIPIAHDPTHKYKDPHWLPVLILDEVAIGKKKPKKYETGFTEEQFKKIGTKLFIK